MPRRMIFSSDNWAGAAPAVIEAITREAGRFGTAYGESKIDRAVATRFNEVFERDVAVFFVATGSAANGLALASVNRPGGAVFCHRGSHILEDECGGVEYLTGGARLFGLDGAAGKLDPATLREAIGGFARRGVHSGQAMAVGITQATEAGTVYDRAEIEAVAEAARAFGLPLHMDGARFANALVRLGCSPAEMTWKAGIDLLSFGATKNGCVAAEAVVVFDPARAEQLPFLRKRAGQLFSKSRFIAAQFDAYLRDDLWLRLAAHANAMADRLRHGVAASGRARLAWPTEANEVFILMDIGAAERLRSAGAAFYDWPVPAGIGAGNDECLVRLVTSFATRADEVETFLGLLTAETASRRAATA